MREKDKGSNKNVRFETPLIVFFSPGFVLNRETLNIKNVGDIIGFFYIIR